MKGSVMLAGVLLAFSGPALAQSFSAEAQWNAFFDTARYERTNKAYAALGAVHYDDGVSAPACNEARAALDDAVRDVPVSIALRHAAMLCAEARGDEAQADAHADALASLVRHAAQDGGTGPWKTPIRVVRPEDVEAWLELAGLERRYAYFADAWPQGGLPLHVAAFDASVDRERHIAFDWVDTLARLASDDAMQGYLIDRHWIANAFLDAWAQDDDDASIDLLALRQATYEADPVARRDRLKAAAGRGGVLAAQSWLALCSLQAFDGCADGLVDAILPLAEKGFAMSRLQLGMAHLRGIGVKQDEAAGRALIEAADRTWDGNGALVQFAAVLDMMKSAHPAWLDADLAAADRSGSALARAYRLASRASATPESLTAEEKAWIALPAHNRRGEGYALLALVAENAKAPDAAEWRERAAEAGDPASMGMRAIEVLDRNPRDEAARARLRAAALQGDSAAVYRLAYEATLVGKPGEAQGWLLGKVAESDANAMVLLGMVYEQGGEGVEKGPADAAALYEELAAEVPAARRQLASMLVDGRGIAKDTTRARRLLEQDPDDLEDASLLGSLLLHQRIPGDVAGGRALLEKAVATGAEDAISDYGMWLAAHETTAEGRRRGITMLRSAEAGGNETVLNNLAWAQCVSPHSDVFNAEQGLAVARRIGAPEGLDSSVIDTVAACEAAAGNAGEAVKLQSLALERLPAGDLYASTREGMQSRLDLYRKGERYIEIPSAQGQ